MVSWEASRKTLNVLVACEESQAVCTAFRELGHRAFSCDIQECSGGHPEWHVVGDVSKMLVGGVFFTQDGVRHEQTGKWDLIVAHPPCTYLTAASAVRLFNPDHTVKDPERYAKGERAKEFFMSILNADCDAIAIENPVPLKCFGLPKYTQVIEPYMFGDPWKKKTCLWLKGLPKLEPTDVVEPLGLWVGATSSRRDAHIYSKYALRSKRNSKERSKTFQGIAKQMAAQWSAALTQ